MQASQGGICERNQEIERDEIKKERDRESKVRLMPLYSKLSSFTHSPKIHFDVLSILNGSYWLVVNGSTLDLSVCLLYVALSHPPFPEAY